MQLGVVEMLLMLVHCCCSKPDQDGARCGDTHSDGLGYGADRGQQGGRGQRKGRTSGTCRQNGLLTIILVLSFFVVVAAAAVDDDILIKPLQSTSCQFDQFAWKH